MELNKHSKRLTQDESQPASQAMLYAVGLTDEDMSRAQVGIASTGYDGNPCNMHLNNLAAEVKVESKIFFINKDFNIFYDCPILSHPRY